MPNFIDRTGQRYGRLIALERLPNKGRTVMWKCVCDCGNQVDVASTSLCGNTNSCGCLRNYVHATTFVIHGMSHTQEHNIWQNMLGRCHNPSDSSYSRYGGRGIEVCEAWRESFQSFYEYIGKRPSQKHSVERIKNDRGYEPGNVKWATVSEQNRNKRSNRVISFNGESLPMCAWAEKQGISYNALRSRLNKGWDLQRALTEPMKR